ncbi:hypothetical protein EXIGLDRAFT_837142 [Exidia glandulosa HHB12029]|uniref:Uncharacterized protein n=1 Tax=Exidia glandulosa HHB12029 TaxID=1314781 RepID=A0A165H3T4_EXIGL|nr:hypothetical protein EXIGLDRAFT_837142 [Exidia glandulosa HHB12029]
MQESPLQHLFTATACDTTMQLDISEPQAPYTDDFPRYLHGAMAALVDATNTFKSAVVRNTALAVARKKIYQAHFRLHDDLAQPRYLHGAMAALVDATNTFKSAVVRNTALAVARKKIYQAHFRLHDDLAQLSTPEFLESIALEAVARDRAHACPSCVAETFFTALGYDGIAEMCGYRVQSALETTVPQYPPPSSFALSFLPASFSSTAIVCPDHGHAQMPTDYVESSSQSGSSSDSDGGHGRRSPRVKTRSIRAAPYTLSSSRGRSKQQCTAAQDGLDVLGQLLGAMNLSLSTRCRRDRSSDSDSSSSAGAQSLSRVAGSSACSSLVDPVDEIERSMRLVALNSGIETGGRSSFAFSYPSDSDTD